MLLLTVSTFTGATIFEKNKKNRCQSYYTFIRDMKNFNL